jgi:hypothetical protein
MKKTTEYTEIETPSISIERKIHMMKEIFKALEDMQAISKETGKTSKEINSKLPKEPSVKDSYNEKKDKKVQLNTPSFIGSLAGVMTKVGVLGKTRGVEKVEVKWYIKGTLKMLNDINPRDM